VTPIIEVLDLKKYFTIRSGLLRKSGVVKAVDGVSFSVEPHQTFGLAGETGCGKTTLAKCVLRIVQPTSGQVKLDGEDIFSLDRKRLKNARRNIQAIFQNPLMSLDPRMTVQALVAEPLKTHKVISAEKIPEKVMELLRKVGLDQEHVLKYPHELSGGQNQRVAIARALAVSPKLIVLDEPTSSLDVSVQAQILNLLTQLQRDSGMGYLFISHDLSVLRYLSDVLSIMYLGRIVEMGPSGHVFENPFHPYTQLLLASVPEFSLTEGRFSAQVPAQPEISERLSEGGCRFYPRCPLRMDKCKNNDPPMYRVNEEHLAACFLYEDKPLAFYREPDS
jgi:oligopeptide/dipeptide ABC transporter ATP-binding protein